ncbi:MAG: YkgJ family cysteine cluster protein [Planctomycetota bacterium]|jgi:Fe-S-cluster containining protein
MAVEAQKPWYRDGLRFSCTQCGDCCGGEPGNVFVSDEEVRALADHVGLDEAAFRRRYTRVVHRDGGQYTSIIDVAPSYDCVFFTRGAGCQVYPLRPRQCRTWPFWRSNLATRADWDEAAQACPGMNHGEAHSAADITAIAADDGLAG